MLKIALGNQARRAPEFPQTFEELVSTAKKLFEDRLTSDWILTYREPPPSSSDVEMIIDSEEEYETFRNSLPQCRGNVVIYIRLIEKPKSANQNSRNNQLETVEEEPEFQSQSSFEDASRSLDFNEIAKKMNTSSLQNDFEQILQDKQESKAKGVDPDFKEEFMKVLLEQLPLIVSHVEKCLEDKKLLKNQTSIKEIHQIQCNGCNKFPVVGARYQCLVCQELNYCELCEEKQSHVHPFVKIRRKEQQDFLPQSLNNSQYSIYPGKETPVSINKIYKAGIQLPSSLDLNKFVVKRNNEETKSENELDFCNWGQPKNSIEISQNASQKQTYKVHSEKNNKEQQLGRDVENFGVFRGGNINGSNEF